MKCVTHLGRCLAPIFLLAFVAVGTAQAQVSLIDENTVRETYFQTGPYRILISR